MLRHPPRPAVVFVLYTLLCAACAWLLEATAVHNVVVLLLVVPVLGLALYYDLSLCMGMLAVSLAAALWSTRGESHLYAITLPTLLGTTLTVALLTVLIRSERKRGQRAEAALERSRENYRIVADYTSDLEFWRTPEGKFMYISPSCLKITGYAPDEFFETPALFEEMIHPEDRQKVSRVFQTRSDETRMGLQEYRILRRDGQPRWVEQSMRRIFDEKGAFLGWRGSLRDTTQRKLVEDVLFVNTLRLRLAFEGTEDGVMDWDLTAGEAYFSPNYAEKLGFKNERVAINLDTLESLRSNIHPDDLPRIKHAIQGHLNGDTSICTIEFRYRALQDDWKWVLYRGKMMEQDEPSSPRRIIGTLLDITDRKHMESALEDSERRYRDMIEHQGEGVFILEEDNCFVYANPAAEELFDAGRHPLVEDSLAGRCLDDFIDADQSPLLHEQMALCLRGFEGSFELVITLPGGERRSLLLTLTPRYDDQKQICGVIGICRDITLRKQTEEKLRYASTHDALTGLYNRTFFEEEMNHLEYGAAFPVSVVMVDVDGLKSVNDHNGHAAGDVLLKEVAKILRRSTRESDIVARIGGDEFTILLPATDERQMQQVMRRIYQGVVAENESGRQASPIDVSTGGATSHKPGSVRQALHQADLRMYENKRKKKGK